MSAQRRKVLVVLGMHRSGTSAITRGLEVLGVDLGGNLMPAAKDNNEKGFFEDLDIHAFNGKLLTSLGSAWDRLGAIQAKQLLEPRFAHLQDEAEALLTGKLAATGIFAFKDPQTSLLIPFWHAIFERMELDAHYLICFRNPLSVAASLRKRDGMTPAKAQLLWAKYSLAALRDTNSCSRLLLDYDALMDAPASQLGRIALAFGLSAPERNPAGLEAFCQEFLTPTLRHTRFDRNQLDAPTEVIRLVRQLHALLEFAVATPGQLDTQQEIEALQAALAVLEPIVSDIDTLSARQAQLETERMQLLAQLHATRDECGEAWKLHDQARKEIQRLADEHSYLGQLHNEAAARNDQIQTQCDQLRRSRDDLQVELQRIYASHSWRLLGTLRLLRQHYRNPVFLVRVLVSKGARLAWRHLPATINRKQRLKATIFRMASPILRQTQAYQDWQRMTGQEPGSLPAPTTPLVRVDEPVEAIRRLQGPAIEEAARLIAFYLPQFHPIPENDEWWGEGFTEWTNVRPARPQYDGHYQPHEPGDLGYYSLDEIETQRQQVEMAKLYGIGGFCFYFYWFGGKRLLEKPIERYLQNPELDLPFCLCWANENWSRRWDGLDEHILIGQSHSSEDDLAFIAHLSQYLRDPRYIRIDGRPLLLVYRPTLLPNAQATARRWRTWCRDNGIGEIYLAYTQSFESVPPGKYGFDAAVEFPPNNTTPPDVTANVQPLCEGFAGKVYDWSVYPKRSAAYSRPPYTLFRGVCPAWDNTPRRKERGISFVNSSPRGYQEWLLNAIRDSHRHHHGPDDRLVFINAWNEWAEGAHLEPDQRYGYAYLEATRMAHVRARLLTNPAPAESKAVAVVIHAYYPDIFEEVVAYLSKIRDFTLKLYISTPSGSADAIRERLTTCPHEHILEELPNHGRDILPFLTLLPRVAADGFQYLVKVHTKKSIHRNDGDTWRRDLYEKLLTSRAMKQALDEFYSDTGLGLLGPAGHVVPMSFYWGSNARTVERLACRMGIRPSELHQLDFVAGTMFFARVDALRPLLNLAIDRNDFEPEEGQVDGTFAHALERAMSISAHAAGLSVRSSEGATTNAQYAFAEATA
ncbi:glycoside hydrolase family 99-like domain-containing protein [Pseudomonas indica]|uniref:glycoside hydrolase family 99-like domain-containing protein n=1 Tax=Pseudomonas indica TaxID=137658 RepID=UPI000BAB4170|nr:glycoside hydrolase family 99-like domain-containing protein [Pseudomonas indica]